MPSRSLILVAATLLTFCSAAAQEAHEVYTLDRTYFVSSKDWFLIEGMPVNPAHAEALIFRKYYVAYVDNELKPGLTNLLFIACQKRYQNHLVLHSPDDVSLKTIDHNDWHSKDRASCPNPQLGFSSAG